MSKEPITGESRVHVTLPEECSATRWSYRKRPTQPLVPFLQFLSTSEFWYRVEYAVRVAFVGVLPTAILAFHPNTTKTWLIPHIMLTYCIVVSQPSVGLSMEHFIRTMRSLLLGLALVQISYGINSSRHWAGWGTLFAGVNILVGLFTSDLVTKLGLFIWSIFMVLQYNGETLTFDKYSGAPEYVKMCVVASALGLLTSFFPYPLFDTWKAQRLEKRIFEMLSQQFIGISESCFCDNLSRSANLVALRQLHHKIEESTMLLHKTLAIAHIEVWFAKRVHTMNERLQLILRLIRDADAALNSLETINRRAAEWDANDAFQQFGKVLLPHMKSAAVKLEWFCRKVIESSDEELLELQAELQRVVDEIDTHFTEGRKSVTFPLLDAVEDGHPFSKFPFLSSNQFMFPWFDSLKALTEFKSTPPPSYGSIIAHILLFPVRDLQGFWSDLVGVVTLRGDMMIRLRESLKLSFAMTTAVALLLNRKVADPAGGAATIGFLMDADPSNNVITGIRFLIGAIFGCVFGLLCQSVSENLTQTIIWIVVITLVTGFGKTGPKWGEVSFFIMFFGLSAMVPGQTDLKIIYTIQQDVTSIVWLVFVSNFFWPSYPSVRLNISIDQSLIHARKFFVTFLQAIAAPAKSGAFDVAKLYGAMNSCRLIALQHGSMIEAASEEPTVRLDNFPASPYLQYNRKLRNFIAHFAPLIYAGDFLMNHSGEEKLHSMVVIEQPLQRLAEALNILLRMLEELIHVKAQTAWGGGIQTDNGLTRPVDDVLAQVRVVRLSAESVLTTAESAFMVQWAQIKSGEHRMPGPYEVPASHMILSAIQALHMDVYDLALGVIAVRDAS